MVCEEKQGSNSSNTLFTKIACCVNVYVRERERATKGVCVTMSQRVLGTSSCEGVCNRELIHMCMVVCLWVWACTCVYVCARRKELMEGVDCSHSWFCLKDNEDVYFCCVNSLFISHTLLKSKKKLSFNLFD